MKTRNSLDALSCGLSKDVHKCAMHIYNLGRAQENQFERQVPENFCHCSMLNDISRKACLVYVVQAHVKSKVLAQPFPSSCCHGNTKVVNAGQICVIFKLRTSTKQKLTQRISFPMQN